VLLTVSFVLSSLFLQEGCIRQFLVDDKGAVLVAIFGVPPFVHEDDALRGVKAGLELHNMLLQRGMQSSVGVTSGEVFCGSVGSADRQV
jgi:hypothetical protein